MESIILRKPLGDAYPNKYYKYNDYIKALRSINDRKLSETKRKRKIFFLDNKFPKRIIDKKLFEITADKDDADLIFFPDMQFIFKHSCYYMIVNGQYYRAYADVLHCTPRYIISFYKNQEKYVDILDDSRIHVYSQLYKICRKNNPTLSDDEITHIKEMFESPDREVTEIAAMLVAKSNIPKHSHLYNQANSILSNKLRYCKAPTKELRAFLNDW